MKKKIKDVYDIIWFESYIKIFKENEFGIDIFWEGYICEMPEKYLETEVHCLIPMTDYGPVIGIEVI